MSDHGYLIHYASPYYDSVKAHEYYEKHKKLKGRANLTDAGKEAASYVKNQIDEEKKQKIEESKQQRDTKIANTNATAKTNIETESASVKSQIEQHTTQMQSKIDSIKSYIANMPSDASKTYRQKLKNDIQKLRETNATARKELQTELSKYRIDVTENKKQENTEHRTEHKENVEKIRSDADSKYESEMSKIASEYQKPATSKTSKTKSTSSDDGSAYKTWVEKNKTEYKKTHSK